MKIILRFINSWYMNPKYGVMMSDTCVCQRGMVPPMLNFGSREEKKSKHPIYYDHNVFISLLIVIYGDKPKVFFFFLL